MQLTTDYLVCKSLHNDTHENYKNVVANNHLQPDAKTQVIDSQFNSFALLSVIRPYIKEIKYAYENALPFFFWASNFKQLTKL
jgi:hypothetical protein